MEKKKLKLTAFVKQITWLIGSETGWGNGYVCLPKGHKYYGFDYDNIDVEVHGGLTFASDSNSLNLNDWPEVPQECRKDHWIIGFDTAHYGDNHSKWPDAESVMAECGRLISQL